MGIDSVTMAFPVLIKRYMPAYNEIPWEFRHGTHAIKEPVIRKWIQFQRDWFDYGFEKLDVVPREGVDSNTALKHLAMIQKSFEPKHEHKVAAIAYLASLWFESVNYTCKKEDPNGPTHHR